ncbi:hypothetical protein LCGC14_1038540 [marine sediment metagenome]|uniref:Transposase IS891/IS1136/IS1341 domain-containing protein n=1 Tax=marine sediment metagenome TaxID=412755 RepID=A0A0F9MSG1_9ZZZZ
MIIFVLLLVCLDFLNTRNKINIKDVKKWKKKVIIILLTEQIQMKKSKELSKLCHLAKNLYNLANWYFRQDFFNLNNFLDNYDLDFILKDKEVYKNLPAQTSQQILKLIIKNWKSYFRANKDYKKNKNKYKRKPKIPNYKKKNGESIIIFTNQQCKIRDGYLYFPKKAKLKPIKTRITKKLNQVRIIPKGACYVIETVYERKIVDLKLNKDHIASIDLGLNRIIATVNNNGYEPFIIKGDDVKSINQYYNKQLAHYRSIENKKGNFQDTKRIKRLHSKRNNKIYDIFHKVSKKVINYCIKNNIGTIIIGYNKGWKQKINIGKRNNQNFVQIPFLKLIKQVEYKGELVGIDVITTTEEYTSQKCSNCGIIKKSNRVNRDLYVCSECGLKIDADLNGAYNIMKKVFPKAFCNGMEVLGLKPQIVTIS